MNKDILLGMIKGLIVGTVGAIIIIQIAQLIAML